METNQTDRIRVCIDHYMEGESTQEELRLLKSYFSGSDEIPADLLPYREMFALLDKEPVRPSADAVERLSRMGAVRKSVLLWPWIAAACAVALLLVLTTPPKGGSAVQPQLAETVIPPPTTPVAGNYDSTETDSVQTVPADTVTRNPSLPDVTQVTLPPVHKTAVAAVSKKSVKDAKSVKSVTAAKEPEAPAPELEIRHEMTHKDQSVMSFVDTTGIGRELMALEREFQSQDSLYILSLLNLDEEATLAANSIYVSLLQ